MPSSQVQQDRSHHEGVSLACEYACLGWGGFFDAADCSQVPTLKPGGGSQLAAILRTFEAAVSTSPFATGSPFEPIRLGDVYARLPAPVLACTADSVLGTLSAALHPPVDEVCFLSFHMSMGEWCFSYVPQAHTLADAVRWFCDAMPESAFLSLMASRLGPLMQASPLAVPTPGPELALIAYDFDFENYTPQLASVEDLEFDHAYFAAADTLDIMHGFSTLTTAQLWQWLSEGRHRLVESLRRPGPARDRWHALVAWHLLTDLPYGPERLPLAVSDLGLTLRELEAMVCLHAEWDDTAPALVRAARELS